MKSVYLVFCFTISPPLLSFSRIIVNIQMRLFSSRTTGWKELLYNIINGTTTCNNDGFGDEIHDFPSCFNVFINIHEYAKMIMNMQM